MEEIKEKKTNFTQTENILKQYIINQFGNTHQSFSLSDSIANTLNQVSKVQQTSTVVKVNDSYSNSLTATGKDDKVKDFTKYTFTNDTLNFIFWLTIYNDSWVFKRAIDKPAQDEIACGIDIQLEDRKEEVVSLYDTYKSNLIELLQWGALFGGSVGFMMFDKLKDVDYEKPMSISKIKGSVMKIYVTDRWYGCSPSYDTTVTSMRSSDFGKPKYYDITFADGRTFKVHHSYILRYEHRKAPNLIKNGYLQGWGYAEGSHIINELMRDDQLKSDITSLINKSLIEIIKMDGMKGLFLGADEENQTQLQKRLEMVNWARNFNSLTFLDKNDDYAMNEFSGLSGLSNLLETNMKLIAAALEMQGVLFGDIDGGFSADTVAMKRYADTILNRCENYVRPVIYKLLKTIYNILGIKEEVKFTFLSLLRKEQDKEKVEGLKSFQELLSGLISDGVLTPALAARSLQKYVTKGIIDFGLDDNVVKKIEEEEQQQNEDLDNALDNLDQDEESGSDLFIKK